jgi:type VI secretion system protein VasG
VLIPYFPVRDENLKQIVRLKLGKIERRLRETHKVALVHDGTLVDAVAARCTEVESGARNVDNILTNTMLPEVSRLLLETIAGGDRPAAIRVTVDAEGELAYEVTPAARDGGYSLGAPAAEVASAPGAAGAAGAA